MLFLGGKLPFVVIQDGSQPCVSVPLLGGWLDQLLDHFKPREIGLLFNPNLYPCHRVFHQLPERVLMTSAIAMAVAANERSSPCSSIMFSMASLIRLPRE